MTSYIVQSHRYKSCWRQQILKCIIEIESACQELSKNVPFVNFHQLNWKFDKLCIFHGKHFPNMGMPRDKCWEIM